MNEALVYEIRLKGHLGDEWSAFFADLAIHHDADGNTRLTGRLPDQAALYGLLEKFSSLGLVLLSLTQSPDDREDA